jgi:hypothetical protein
MKHPVRGNFDTAVTEAGVNVTFKPTNSIYSFYRLAESEDIARLGSVSLERVRHAGPSGDTEDYSSDEVQDIALRVAAKSPRSPPHRRALYNRRIEGFAIQADGIDQKR